jgi:hypothetical protein
MRLASLSTPRGTLYSGLCGFARASFSDCCGFLSSVVRLQLLPELVHGGLALGKHGADLLRHICLKSEHARSLGHLRDIRVAMVRREVKHAGRFHFEFHEG